MKEPNDLPNFIDKEEAIKLAKADFSRLLKNYTLMSQQSNLSIKRESLLNSETYHTHAHALQNVRYLKEEAKKRKEAANREQMYSLKQSIAHLDKNHARIKQAKAQDKRINQ